jgi:hypothetical protein
MNEPTGVKRCYGVERGRCGFQGRSLYGLSSCGRSGGGELREWNKIRGVKDLGSDDEMRCSQIERGSGVGVIRPDRQMHRHRAWWNGICVL